MASNAKSTQAVACNAKFTNEDYFAAVKSDNAHRYPGVRCGLTSLSELRKQYPKGSTCDMSEFTLPTVEENGFTHKPYNPDLIHEPTEHILNGERTTQDHRQVMAHVGLSDGKGLILAGGKVSRAMCLSGEQYAKQRAFWLDDASGVWYSSADYEYFNSDFDLFAVGLSESEAIERIENMHRDLLKKYPNTVWYRNENCVTIISTFYVGPKKEKRQLTVQIILRLYSSVSEVVHSFDVGPAQIAWDGEEIWLTSLGCLAFTHGLFALNLTRRRRTYEARLAKYLSRGFRLVLPNLDAEKALGSDLRWGLMLPFARLMINHFHQKSISANGPSANRIKISFMLSHDETPEGHQRSRNDWEDYGGVEYDPDEVALVNYRKLLAFFEFGRSDTHTPDARTIPFIFMELGKSLEDVDIPLPNKEMLLERYYARLINKLDLGKCDPRTLKARLPIIEYETFKVQLMFGEERERTFKEFIIPSLLKKVTEHAKGVLDNIPPMNWRGVEAGTTLSSSAAGATPSASPTAMINPFTMQEVTEKEWYGDYYKELE